LQWRWRGRIRGQTLHLAARSVVAWVRVLLISLPSTFSSHFLPPNFFLYNANYITSVPLKLNIKFDLSYIIGGGQWECNAVQVFQIFLYFLHRTRHQLLKGNALTLDGQIMLLHTVT